ncbi:MAG: hypothetical protein AABW45_02775 [Nanoarchaeota archaeon]
MNRLKEKVKAIFKSKTAKFSPYLFGIYFVISSINHIVNHFSYPMQIYKVNNAVLYRNNFELSFPYLAPELSDKLVSKGGNLEIVMKRYENGIQVNLEELSKHLPDEAYFEGREGTLIFRKDINDDGSVGQTTKYGFNFADSLWNYLINKIYFNERIKNGKSNTKFTSN